jgi:hypothetical protein
MTRPSALRAHRRSLTSLAAAVGLLSVVPGVGVAHAASHAPARHSHGSCPAAESLVPNTHWAHHTLAKGVTVASGTAKDGNGLVNMHVLRVDLSRPRVSMEPLVHSLGERLPLSTLAQHHPHLVAATNTGYFDFEYGAPTQPLIIGGVPQVISHQHESVVGVGKDGRLEAGQVWMSSTLSVGKSSHSLVAENETYPPSGVGVYNSRWGSGRVPGSWGADTRSVVNGALAPVAHSRRAIAVPNSGYLLQARGHEASSWLNGLPRGAKVSLADSIKTTAKSPFMQAYGVGIRLVSRPGVAKTGFSCDSANTRQPARTAIGWTHGGRTLVMAIVADHPHTSMHGLDEDQMSKLMVQLGVSHAYAFDGSGSTELLAKFRGSSLALQNYPADGAERPMPLGLGISVAPAKHHQHHGRKHHS